MRSPRPIVLSFLLISNLSYSIPDSLGYFIPETKDGIQLQEYLTPDSLRKLELAKRSKTIDQSITFKVGVGIGGNRAFANDNTLDTFSMVRFNWDIGLELSLQKNVAIGLNYRRNSLLRADPYAPLKGNTQYLLPYIALQFYPSPNSGPQSMAYFKFGYGPSWHKYSELPLDISNISSTSEGKFAFLALGFSGRGERGTGGFIEFEINSEFMDRFYSNGFSPVFSQSRPNRLLDVNYLGWMVKFGILFKGRIGNSVLPRY